MSDESPRVGLGKVVYSVDAPWSDERCETEEEQRERRDEQGEVVESDCESFPASDPPSFAGGTPSPTS